jgi:hypothetical protein
MRFRLEHRPYNNKGHPSFRPWRVEEAATGEMVATFTTQEIALGALDLLNAGEPYHRQLVYRSLRHGQGSYR